MLRSEDNELLCHVGPGTPMGNLFRRFWLPALVPEEIQVPDCDPVRPKGGQDDLAARVEEAVSLGDPAADELRGLEGWVGEIAEKAATGIRRPAPDFDPFTVGDDFGRWIAQLGGWLKARGWRDSKERPEIEEIPEIEVLPPSDTGLATGSGDEVVEELDLLDGLELSPTQDAVRRYGLAGEIEGEPFGIPHHLNGVAVPPFLSMSALISPLVSFPLPASKK